MKKIIHKSLSISKYDGVRILKGIFIGKEKSDQNMKKRDIFLQIKRKMNKFKRLGGS